MKKKLIGMVCGLVLASGVHAHGNSHDSAQKPAAFDATAAEQKAFGKAGDPKKVTRTIHISMDDKMRFTPSEIRVNEGEVVKFVVSNGGAAMHEMVLGTRKDLLQHAAMMRKFPAMEHDEPYMAHAAPGKEQTLVWHFNKAGEFEYGCLIPGHFEAGMAGKIKVMAAAKSASR